MNQIESEKEKRDYCKDRYWLLNLKCYICKKTQFVIDALFDWKPMYFFEYWCKCNVSKF